MRPLLATILLSFLLTTTVYPESSSQDTKDSYPAGQQLYHLAVERGIILLGHTQEFVEKQIAAGNAVVIWILLQRPDQVKSIDKLKNIFHKERGVIVRNPSEHYVDRINFLLYARLKGGEVFSASFIGSFLIRVKERI